MSVFYFEKCVFFKGIMCFDKLKQTKTNYSKLLYLLEFYEDEKIIFI